MWGWVKVREQVLFVTVLKIKKGKVEFRDFILTKCLWSANFIIPVSALAQINPHQHHMAESHYLSPLQTWIIVEQTLLMCLFTVCWVVSDSSGHMEGCGASTVLCHFIPAWQNMQTKLIEGSDGYFKTWVRLAVLDGWFDKGQRFSSLLHKCSHLSIWLTLKAQRSLCL